MVVASAVLRRLSTSIGADLPKDPHHHRTAPAVAIPAARGRRRQRLPRSRRAARRKRSALGPAPAGGSAAALWQMEAGRALHNAGPPL